MKIIEVVRVAPASGSEKLPTQKSLPLTFFDILWLRLPPVERIFFYEFPHLTPIFFDTVLPKLKDSLAIALGYFFPLSTYLTWPLDSNKPIIKYNQGDTVSLTVAESEADFNHLAGTDLCEATEIHHLVPQLTISDEQATVLSLQRHISEGSTRGIFHLSRPNIEKLKNLVLAAKQKGEKKLHLSTFVVSLAYAWVCRVKAEGPKCKKNGLALTIDCRARLEPPIPPTYFGNCVGGRFVAVETKDLLREEGLIVAVEAISEALETLNDGVLSGAENWSSRLHDGLNTDEKIFGAAGSPRFEVYSSDFGWGRPKKVEMTSIDRTGAFCLSDSRNGDGVEIGFVSSKEGMEAFISLFVKGLAS